MQTVICESFDDEVEWGDIFLWRYKYFYDEDAGVYFTTVMDAPEVGVENVYGVYHPIYIEPPIYSFHYIRTDKGHWGP